LRETPFLSGLAAVIISLCMFSQPQVAPARRSNHSARTAAGSRRTAPRPPWPSPATCGITSAGVVGVGRGDQHAARFARQALQKLFQRGNGRRPHPAGGGGVQRVEPTAFDRCQNHGVDRRLAHCDAARTARAAREAEQRLVAACRKAAPRGAAHLDARQESGPVPMGEPGAAMKAFTDDIIRARGEQDMLRQSPL
jgi:hypothetical protein